jgi:hypothetical protein
MKHLHKQFLVVLFSLVALVACKDEKDTEQKLERIFKSNIKEVTGKTCLSFSMKKEDDKYFIDALMSDSSRLQAFMTGDPDGKTQIVETLNSVTARLIQENVRVAVSDLVLNQKDSVMYQGTAKLLTGETIKIMVHKENGWYPENDMFSLATIMKHQLKEINGYKTITVDLEPLGQYEYKATVKADNLPPSYLRVIHLGTEFKYDLMDKITVTKDNKPQQ